MANSNSHAASTGWLSIGGAPHFELEQQVKATLAQRIESKQIPEKDVAYVQQLERSLLKGRLELSTKKLEQLRTLCALWEVSVTPPQEISSHRPFIGPIIVACKRMIVPMIGALLKDTFHKQREFNAAVIRLVADLAREVEASQKREEDEQK